MAINNNVQNVKFLRNGNLFDTHEAALTGIQAEFNSGITSINADGTAILARYTATGNSVKTLVGFVYFADAENKSLTIIDVEGSHADVEALRTEINNKLGDGIGSGESETVTAQLTALSGTTGASSAETSVAGAKAYAKDYTDGQIGSLEYTGVTTGNGKVIVNVTESDGIISGLTAEVGGLKLTEYSKSSDSGAVTTADSINSAISKLENQIEAEEAARADAINALDLSTVSGNGEVIIAVSQENGQVAAVSSGITDITLTGYTLDTGATGSIASTDSIESAFNKIENNIAAIDAANSLEAADKSVNVVTASTGTTVGVNIRSGEKVIALDSDATSGGVYTDLDVVKVTTGLPANVKERYQLLATDDTQIGANIDIYKDSSLLSVALLHADTTSNPQVLPTYDKETDAWTDIPSTAQTEANQALCFAYEDVEGTVVVAAVPVGSFINEQEFASGVTWDSTANKVRGVVDPTSETFLTVGANGFKLAGVQTAINNAVGDAISGLDASVSAETTHINVKIDEVDGVLTAVTLTEDNIASADDLAALSAQTVSGITSTNGSITANIDDNAGNKSYNIETDASKIKMSGFTSNDALSGITSSSSITQAFEEVDDVITSNEQVTAAALTDLDDRVNTVSGNVSTISGNVNTISGNVNTISGDVDTLKTNYISGVTVNNAPVTNSNHVAPISITAATSVTTASTSNAIVVDTDANGNITLGLNYIDCGTY